MSKYCLEGYLLIICTIKSGFIRFKQSEMHSLFESANPKFEGYRFNKNQSIETMEYLNVEIGNVKNIVKAELSLPFENGIYALVGSNGCGKSTIMLCLAQLLRNQLKNLAEGDYSKERNIGNGWFSNEDPIKLNGLYEGSLFYGTRFMDSSNIERLIKRGRISKEKICDADEYVKQHLSFILQNDTEHYKSLKRIKNRVVADNLGISNLPYFIESNGHLISQYRMSSGECMLISLLHFIYNSIIRRSLPDNQKIVVLIDELELALHPIAVLRLIDLLKDLVDEHDNLVVYLSTHSPEIIKILKPIHLFKVDNNNGIVTIENNCYPSYLIRDLYSNISPDFLLLVEDELSQLFVNRILDKYALRTSKLVHCVPVGGWQNVLELHDELYKKKIMGTNTKIISILDGDVEGKLSKNQKKYPHLFLPIQSIEKYLYNVIKENSNPTLRKKINDKFFIVRSLDEIVADYNKGTLTGSADNNKNFYSVLTKELAQIGTDIHTFILGLMDDIEVSVDARKFIDNLKESLV